MHGRRIAVAADGAAPSIPARRRAKGVASPIRTADRNPLEATCSSRGLPAGNRRAPNRNQDWSATGSSPGAPSRCLPTARGNYPNRRWASGSTAVAPECKAHIARGHKPAHRWDDRTSGPTFGSSPCSTAEATAAHRRSISSQACSHLPSNGEGPGAAVPASRARR